MFTLSSALVRTAEQCANAPAMLDAGETWGDHTQRVARLSAALAAKGVQRGDRIAVIARNSSDQARLLHSGYWSGALPVPINWRLAPGEVAEQLADCQPKLIVVEAEFEGLVPPDLRSQVSGWQDLHAMEAAADACEPAELTAEDAALLVYTGGTTGRAKGVLLTHGNIVSNAFQSMEQMRFSHQSRYLHVAPMFHSADLLGTAVTILGGAHAYLADFGSDAFSEAVERNGITHTMLPPTAIRFLLDSGQTAKSGTLERLIYGSSVMSAATIRQACQHFDGVALLQGYGLTETAPLLTILGPEAHESILAGNDALADSAGRPLPGVELRLEAGEVMARGPNIARNYWNQPEETARAFADGWFRTGDLGRFDGSGRLYLMGRAKDMIVTGGENVYAVEVERVLMAHPQVREVAVFGLPDPTWGETVTAVVVAEEKPVDDTELIRHCKASLGGFKVPKRFIWRDHLPRSALGKVLKHVLRNDLEDAA